MPLPESSGDEIATGLILQNDDPASPGKQAAAIAAATAAAAAAGLGYGWAKKSTMPRKMTMKRILIVWSVSGVRRCGAALQWRQWSSLRQLARLSGVALERSWVKPGLRK